MTKIITRFFESSAQARAVKHELVNRQRLSVRIVSLFDSPAGMEDALTARGVVAATAKAYAERMGATGGAVLLVRAGYKPLGVAKTTRDVTAAMGAVDMGRIDEEAYVKEPVRQLSVLPDQPLLLTRMRDPDSTTHHMANWPIPLISRRKPWNPTVFPRHQRMAAFPVPLLDERKPFDEFAFPRHARMANWPIGLLVPGHKYMAKFPFAHIVPGHKHMAKFPFGHIVPGHKHYAKFPFGHLVPHKWRHMANWPFPLLINGKKHTNALVPGHKFMAKFPFGHIVPG
ncbi:MAG: PucR family transcriptional regulator, partial [Pseudomonadota bacterium]